MRRSSLTVPAPCAAIASAAPATSGEALIGFTRASRKGQARAEQAFRETPSPEKARQWLFALTEGPHVAGTPNGRPFHPQSR